MIQGSGILLLLSFLMSLNKRIEYMSRGGSRGRAIRAKAPPFLKIILRMRETNCQIEA